VHGSPRFARDDGHGVEARKHNNLFLPYFFFNATAAIVCFFHGRQKAID
jgi:hypothetical protein